MSVLGYRKRLVVETYSDVAELGEARWPRSCVPRSLYLTYPWLASQQGWNTPETVHVALCDPEEATVLAALSCHVFRSAEQRRFDNCSRVLLDLDHPRRLADSLPPDARADLIRIRAQVMRTSALSYPALVATGVNGGMFGYAAQGTDPTEQQIIETQLLDAFDQVADRLGIATRAFWYVRPADFATLGTSLERRGYVPALVNADCYMDVTWSSFDEYLALRSHKTRNKIKAEIRRFEAAGCSVELAAPDMLDGAFAQLYADHRRRYGHDADPATILYGYQQVRSRIGEKMRIFVAKSGQQVLGFSLAYEHDQILYGRESAFPPRRNDNIPVYFNTTFHAPHRHAIARGIRRLEYGTEAYRAKKWRGFSVRPMLAYVRSGTTSPDGLAEYLDLYGRAVRAYLSAQGVHELPAGT